MQYYANKKFSPMPFVVTSNFGKKKTWHTIWGQVRNVFLNVQQALSHTSRRMTLKSYLQGEKMQNTASI